MDVALLIERLVPGAEYTGSLTSCQQSCFDALVWTDARAKPTWQDILDEDIVYQKETLMAFLADYRWKKETGGIVFNGLPVRTDDRSKMLLSAIQKEIDELGDPNHTRYVKTVAGFYSLNDATLSALYDAVVAHVQKCFDCEYVVLPLVQDGTYTTEAEVVNAFETEFAA